MTVELLFVPGCPTEQSAPALVRSIMEELGISADLRITPVASEEDARARRFLGSPTIRVDGVEIYPGARARTDFGLG